MESYQKEIKSNKHVLHQMVISIIKKKKIELGEEARAAAVVKGKKESLLCVMMLQH